MSGFLHRLVQRGAGTLADLPAPPRAPAVGFADRAPAPIDPAASTITSPELAPDALAAADRAPPFAPASAPFEATPATAGPAAPRSPVTANTLAHRALDARSPARGSMAAMRREDPARAAPAPEDPRPGAHLVHASPVDRPSNGDAGARVPGRAERGPATAATPAHRVDAVEPRAVPTAEDGRAERPAAAYVVAALRDGLAAARQPAQPPAAFPLERPPPASTTPLTTRAQSMAAAAAAAEDAQDVEIRIGRIDVKVAAPPSAAPARSAPDFGRYAGVRNGVDRSWY